MTWPQMLYLLPVVPAFALAVSDFRYRSIPVSWLAAFAASTLLTAMLLSPVRTVLHNALTNVLLLGWILGGVWLYLKLRHRRQPDLFRRHVGSGDMVFVLLLTPFGPLPDYLRLLLGGCTAGLIYWVVVRIAIRRPVTIPLVSALGLVFIVYAFHRFYTWPS